MEKAGSGQVVRRVYSDEFKAEAVRLVKSGERTQAEAARNLGIGVSTISKWCNSEELPAKGCKAEDSDEVKRLKAENRRLMIEHEILKKAAAFFAKNLT